MVHAVELIELDLRRDRLGVLNTSTLLGSDRLPDAFWPGSEVSPGCLLQNQNIHREIRYHSLQPSILLLYLLESFSLVYSKPTELLTPFIICLFRYREPTAGFCKGLSLPLENLRFPKLRDDLLGCVSFLWHLCFPFLLVRFS